MRCVVRFARVALIACGAAATGLLLSVRAAPAAPFVGNSPKSASQHLLVQYPYPSGGSGYFGPYRTPYYYAPYPDYYAAPRYYAPPPAYYPPPAYGYAPPPVYVEVPVRPSSCGKYRYWNGSYCADARYERPYTGPRW
jgi:hypothetical protein